MEPAFAGLRYYSSGGGDVLGIPLWIVLILVIGSLVLFTVALAAGYGRLLDRLDER